MYGPRNESYIILFHPKKLYTKKCSTIDPSAKSAKARSGDTALYRSLFNGFTCDRSDAVSTNCPTVLENPAKNALNGKLVTVRQYKNCITPDSMMNTRKASIVLILVGVSSE